MELKENEPRSLTDKIVESMSEANAEDYAESEANTYVEPRYGPKPEGEAEPMLKPEPINRPIPVQRINSGSIYENPYSTNVYHDYGGLRISLNSNDQSRNKKWSLSYLIIALVVGIVIGATVTGLSMHFTSNPVCETVSTASSLVTATPSNSIEKLEEEIQILKTNQSNLVLDLENCKSSEIDLIQARTHIINICDAEVKDLQKKLDLLSPWSEWSSCSNECWGTKVRTNKCSDKEQIKECNQFPTCPRSVLVMDTFNSTTNPQSPPLLIDFQGNIQRELKLNFEKETTVWAACGAVLNGQHWLIGGYNEQHEYSKQISRIDGCNVKRVSSLEFDFADGACNTNKFEEEKILFCFGNDDQDCHLFDGKSVQKAKSTVFKHRSIYQLATYHGQPLTTGSSEPEHAKTEIMSIETGEWESGPDYPFYSMISNYGTVSTGSSAFIIGGWIGKSSFPWRTSIIVQFQNNEWNKIGNLKEVKSNPSAILHNEEHLVIGGDPQKTDGSVTTEVWNFETKTSRTNNQFKNREYWNPILFLVNPNFCTR